MYGSGTLDAFIDPQGLNLGDPPDPLKATVSNLCLSCHDGTVAIDSLFIHVPPRAGTRTGTIPAQFNIGTALSDDHPINFDYTLAQTADGGLHSLSLVETGGLKFFGGLMQCATCHNPHGGEARPFLRKSNHGSSLCFACHKK